MNFQLIIKDIKGNLLARHTLNSNQSLTLQAPQHAASFEIHSNNGQPPKKIHVTKADGKLSLEMIDDVTGEQYDIVLDNFPAAEQPVILASGSDGVVYSYEYDAASDFYQLSSTSVESIASDNGISAMGIAGGVLAAAAAIGIAVGAGGGGKHHHSSDDSNAGSADSGQAGLIRDQAGNILTNGSTLTDSTPTFSGEGMKPGSTVVIKDGDTVIGEATVDDDGKWSLTPDAPLADGDHSIVIDGTDADGNETSNTIDVIVDADTDTSAGDAGEADAPSDNGTDTPADGGEKDSTTPGMTDDAGNPIADGGTTSDSTPTIGGDGMEPGSTVTISDGDTVIGEVTVDDDGSWSFTPDEPLADGDHALVIDGTDVNGNEVNDTVNVVIDTEATTPGLTDDKGNPIADGGTTSDSTPTIGGDGMEPGSTVTISDGDTVIGEVTVDDDGSWTFTPDEPLADGDHALVIDGTDANGNDVNDTVNIVVDPTKPDLTDDAGNPINNGDTTSDNTPTIGGGGMEPGSDVTITDGDKVIGEVTVDDDGNWTFTPDEPLADGDHALVIDGTDANGDDVSKTVDIVVDTEASTPGLTDDAGNPIEDGGTTSDSTPTIGGGGMEPGSDVTITDGDKVIGEVTVDEDGNWTFTPDEPLADGDHALVIDGTDANGNNVNDTVNIVVDTEASTPGLTDDAGNPIEDGTTTSDTTPTIGGGGMAPGSDVTITDGDKVIGEVTVDEDGNWTFTPDEPLADGDHALVIDGTDANGNNVNDTVNIVVDTEATDPVMTDDGGRVIADGGTTTDSTPTIGGGGMEPGSTVTISDGDKVIGEVTVDEDGNWTFTPDEPLADGNHAITIDGTNTDGNTASDTVNIVVDTGASDQVIIDDTGKVISDGDTTSDSTPTIGGQNMEPGSTVTISDGDTVLGEATVGDDGKWSFTPDQPLADGDHTITIAGTDAHGNATSDTSIIVVDTEASTPVLTDDAGNVLEEGATTSDSTPTFGGDGMKPGSTVTITDGDKAIGEATVGDDGSWSFTPDQPLADGEHAITIDGTNADGNGTSNTVNIVVDTEATTPVLTDDAGNALEEGATTSDSTPTFGGDGMKPGSTVTITDGDKVIGEATVADDGSWSFTPDQPLADGEHAITIDGTNADGNGTSDTVNIVVDTEATTPVLTDDAGNVIEDGGTTSDSTPTFGGDGMEPGSTVTISDGDTVLGEATVGEDGNWSFTPDQPLAEGEHAITIDGTNTDGNGTTDTVNIVVDTEATAPVLTDDNGNAIADGTTTSDSTPTFGGDGMKPGSTVTITDGDTVIGEVTVDDDGSWSFTPDEPLENGDHTITIDGVNADGNGTSDTVNITVDTSAPVLTDDNGNAIVDGSTTSDSTPTFGGDGMEPGSTVTITDGDDVIGEVVVGDDGSWSFTPDEPLADGSHAITVDGTNADGIDTSSTVNIVVDTSATDPVLTDDAGNPIADGDTTSDSTPTIGGSGMEPDSTVTISDGDKVLGEATVDKDGNWSFTPDEPLADGDHALVIDGTDANGNAVNDTVNIVIDTEASTPGLTDDAGNPIEDGTTTSDNTPTIGGGGMEPDSTVTISDGDKVIGEVTVDEDGNWTFTPDEPLADGSHEITAEGTDANGNHTNDTVNIVVDTRTPTVVMTDDAGNEIKDGDFTNDSTPTLKGSDFESGTKITISEGDNVLGEVTADENGNWSFTPTDALSDSEHILTVAVSDAEGNTQSGNISFTVDTIPPEGIDIAAVVIVNDKTGEAVGAEGITADSTPTFSGEGQEAGATVIIRDGDQILGETTVDEDGNWSFTPEEKLEDGDHSFTFEVIDEVGNSSGQSDALDLTISAAKGINTGVIITDDNGNVLVDGDMTNDSTPTFSGKDLAAGSTVVISDGDTVLGTVTVGTDGSWTFTPEAALGEGDHALTVTVTDPDNNKGSDTVNVVVDTIAPDSLDPSDVVLSNDNGEAFVAGTPISDSTPTFSAQGQEAGDKIIVRDGDTVLGEATVAEDGSWSFTPETALSEGDHSFTYEVIDGAGNSSGQSDPVSWTVDSVAPEGVDISTVVITDETGAVVDIADTQNDSHLTFSGSDLEPGATVTIYDKGEAVGNTTVDKEGNWSYTDESGLYDGSHEITFTVSDAAGNSSEPSAALDLNVAAIILTATDNVSSGAAVGFEYPISEDTDLGTVLSDGELIAFNNKITSDPIVVADGTVMDLTVSATSSAFLNIGSNSTLILQKYDSSTGEWVTVSQDDSGNLFGMFGWGASTSTLTLSGLTAGSYQLVYSTSGLNVGVGFELDASKTVYTLADKGTVTDYTTATGNVMSDADGVYGTDSIPHSAYTSVTSVSMTNSDGTVTTVTLDSTTTKATLVGQYGTLTINADGSYEYVPNVAMDSIGKVDNFTYTITDSSTGATSSATLHVQIGTTNDALDLSWDATDPSANAITDIASSNEADASVTVTYHSTNVSGSATVNSGTETYSQSFTVNSADDLVTGSLTLTTKANFLIWNENFSTAMNITYDVQILNEDGTWSTVQEYTKVVAAGTHNSEVILNVDLSTLDLDAGTYRIAVTTTGATNTVTLNMSAEVVSTTDYDITASHVAKGNLLTDEGTDGSVDKLSSVYTQLYAKAGDNTADTNVDSSYAFITESGVKIVGQYGTLVVYNNGSYTYTPNTSEIPAGSQDVFTYALKGANGEVVNATLTINLGVEVDGSNGGALNFHGTEANDVFAVYDTDFAAVDGADGSDTLAWHGSSNLVLSDVASKVSNIEAIDLLSDGKAGNVVVDAQSVEDVTDDSNTLYIKGSSGDTVTMTGSWNNAGTVIVDSISYTHYTATADDGSTVNLYVQNGVSLSAVACDDSTDGADYTVTSAAEVVGTDNGDTFSVSDTSFTSIDGGDGFDTLSWNGSGTLTVSDIASKVSNIEEIDLLNDTGVDNLLISAQNVADITDENNTLYVKGSTSDTLTLSGSWTLVGSEVVNNVNYNHYTSKTADGQSVDLYVDRDIKFSSTETVAENNAADITGDVTLVNDSVQQTVTNNTASSTFTSDSFTINSSSDLQEINFTVSGTGMNAANTASATWSLQVYNQQTYSWDTVTSGTQDISNNQMLNVALSGQNSGVYRVVVDTTQSGFDAGWWRWHYDTLTINVDVSIVSTTDYVVTSSSSVTGSVFTTDNTTDGSILVKSIAAGIVAGAANYTVVAAAGTKIAGTYGTLTIHQDGSYTYTLNSESVIKLAGSEDSFTYVLADGTTKNLIMTVGVDVDGSQGGALILAGTIGDDSFSIYDTHFTTVDGKSGSDTLVWKGQGDLTLSDIADKVHNIEIIDLQANGVAAVLTLTADDIEKVTDADNALYVRGGSEDSLSLQGTWEMSGVTTLNNITYKLYTGTALDGTAVKLFVQEGLTFHETSEITSGELSSDELHDLSVVSVSQNGETVEITDGSVSFKGAYGTLVIDGEGHYNYVADDSAAHSGHTDSFTYTLSDGSNASLSFNLGVEIDGSAGGELTFTGTGGNDVFAVYDTDFISVNGADGGDTLAWHGGGSLNLSNISSKVSNIETVDLLNDQVSENLVVSAESLMKVTDEHNTLYVRGGDGDTITLNGSWESTGETLVNGVTYNHYTSTTTDGSTVQLYVEDDVTIG